MCLFISYKYLNVIGVGTCFTGCIEICNEKSNLEEKQLLQKGVPIFVDSLTKLAKILRGTPFKKKRKSKYLYILPTLIAI